MTSTTDEFPSEDLQQGTEPTKASRRPQQRGKHMTACKRAAQIPDDMESRNNGCEMWCIHCHVPVNYLKKSYATGHIKGATHKKHKKEGSAH